MNQLTNWGNDVAVDVVLGTLLGQALSETNHCQLGSYRDTHMLAICCDMSTWCEGGRKPTGVVALAEATEETGSRGGVDDTAVLLLSEVRPSSAGALVGASDVDLHDEVPVLVLHVLEADVSQNASIVDEHVDSAKGLDGSLDNLVAILD
jgi:hypothetical protein